MIFLKKYAEVRHFLYIRRGVTNVTSCLSAKKKKKKKSKIILSHKNATKGD